MYYVYIITNKINSVVYVGITNNLERRLYEHKHKLIEGFSARYNLYKLVYFETTNNVEAAIAREKQIKGWTRAKKDALIASINPKWLDLAECYQGDSSTTLRYAQNDSVGVTETTPCHSEQIEESLKNNAEACRKKKENYGRITN